MSFMKVFSRLTSSEMEVNGSKTVNHTDDGSIVSNADGKSLNNKASSASVTGVAGSKAVSGRGRLGENGFEEQGGYMAAKKAKLDNQFKRSTRIVDAENGSDDHPEGHEIFKGISIYINGYTNPPEPELRGLFIRHGGTFHPYHSITGTTYVIATNLSAPSKRLYGSKTVKPSWITDSIACRKVLDVRNYMLYNMNEEKNQTTLSQFLRGGKETNESVTRAVPPPVLSESLPAESVDPCGKSNDEINHQETSSEACSSDEEFFECSQEVLNSSPPRRRPGNVASVPLLTFDNQPDPSNNTPVPTGEDESNCNANITAAQKSPNNNSYTNSPNKTGKIKTATDEGFIEDFFGRSRLHLISEQKKEMQMLISNLRKNINAHSFTGLETFQEEIESLSNGSCVDTAFADTEVILMHIDLDCFFVSVGLLSRPHLRGKPVVVTHSTGKTQESRSDIACASYEARKFGVRNGMWVGEAKEKCPNLEVIPYDFEEYRRISKLFFEAVASVTLDVEPCSVDEMVVDATSVLKRFPGATPEDLARFFRKVILSGTQCPASVGIGSNRLLAKLAVKLAKPDGVHYLKDCDAPLYIQSLHVRDLPGVGWSNEGKLRESFNVETCADLLNVPLKDLKSVFGEKTGEKMHSLCKGIDTSEIKVGLDRPKSLSVDVNFGIRFQKEEDVTTFLTSICKELANRAEKIQAVSSNFTLKLLIRKKGAGEPLKQGGHGIVDCVTRSRKLMNPTRNWQEIYKNASSLIRAMRFPPTDFRGVGVTLTDLTFDCDKPNKKSIQRTLTDMPVSNRAQKMLSLSQKMRNAPATSTRPNENSAFIGDITPALENTDIVDDSTNHETGCSSTASTFRHLPNGVPVSHPGIDKTFGTKTTSVQTSTEPEPLVDINMLRQLPREIAEEQCQFYGIDKELLDKVDEALPSGESNQSGSYYDNVEAIDQSFLLALPENIRQDVMLQLQEAKGTKVVSDAVLDDQQPCSSRQAMERHKIIDENRKHESVESNNDVIVISTRDVEIESESDHLPTTDPDQNEPMVEEASLAREEQVTPILKYTSESQNEPVLPGMDPKDFWNSDVDGFVLPPDKKVILPALNNVTEVADVRNLIREGLEGVDAPTSDDVLGLEQYFRELVTHCWLQQAGILLKFIYRQTKKLPVGSKWTPILIKIIEDSQQLFKELYHGPINLED